MKQTMRKVWSLVLLVCLFSSAGCDEPKKRSANSPSLSWEDLGDGLDRAKVPGGWLVLFQGYKKGGLTFVPDPEHKWSK